MTPHDEQPGHEKWQLLYSSADSRWQDLGRMGAFLLPIAGLIFLATIYAVIGYVYMFMDAWAPQQLTRLSLSLYLLRIGLLIFAPLLATIIGLLFIFRQTKEFVFNFYQPEEDEKLGRLIRRKLLGVLPLPPPLNLWFKYPFLLIKTPSLDENHWARWFGGPATLVIYDGVAVYLERGSKFSRVVGPGLPMAFLDRDERIKEVVDLRPQTKIGEVMPWTKDGIRIKLTLRAECQISASAEAVAQSSSKFRFPFDPLAVKKAVERITVRAKPDGELLESPWQEGAWGTITGSVISYVAGHNLDELFLAPRTNGNPSPGGTENHAPSDMAQILSHKILAAELEKIRSSLAHNGVSVSSIQITKVEMPREVLELRARYWETAKQRLAVVRNSRAEADRIRIREQAHAEAQRMMLNAITEKLEKVDRNNLTEPLILSLSGIIDQGLDDPIVRPLIAKESFDVLNRVRKMLQEGF
jgi:hypothetical protein